jgi:hypothetical protein
MNSVDENKNKNILDSNHILAWLKSIKEIQNPLGLYSYLRQIESREYWVLTEDQEGFQWIKELAESLEKIKDEILFSPEKYPDIIRVLSSINCGQSLFILNQLNKKSPGLFEGMINACQNENFQEIEKEAKVFLSRIKLLARREYFLHVFSKENRQWTNNFLKKIKEEEGV